VFSNPPFAGRETDPHQLEKFESTRGESGQVVSTPKSIPFVEHILNLLVEGGRAALVLPGGIFNSQSHQFKEIREIIWKKSEITAIIGLPHWVFFHTGCDVQGALLFLKRTNAPRADYDIFMDWADGVGYDAAGRKTPNRNDFPDILERFKKRNKANLFRASVLRKRGRIDPLYYQPGDHQITAPKNRRSAPLTELLVPSSEIIHRSKTSAVKVRYAEVGDTDPNTGRITNMTEYEIRNLPSRAKYVIRENMLLIPNHRNSIKSGRSVVLVPPEHDGVVVTSRFIVARANVPALYMYQVLNLPFIKEKMLRLVSGSSSTEIKFAQLKEIIVPLPDEGDFDLFIEKLQAVSQDIEDARRHLTANVEKRDQMINRLYGPERTLEPS
jgi:hypothetical protein